ncbi:MAG: hypothetical protein ACYTGB_02095 [Planctomycetota bacterium]|jgi:hypothetical protein
MSKKSGRTIEGWFGVPPGRDSHVLQLFLGADGPQWGEIVADGDQLRLELYPVEGRDAWSVDIDELTEVFSMAREKLQPRG